MSMRFAGLKPLFTEIPIPALTDTTVYLVFNANDTTGPITLAQFGWTSLPEYELRIENGRLYFCTIYNILSGSPDEWYCDVSAATRYCVGLKYNFNGSANTPVIFINGVKQTLTKSQNRSGTISAHGSDYMTIGGSIIFSQAENFFTETQQFGGRIGDLYIDFTRQQTDAEMQRHTGSWLKGFSYYHQRTSSGIYCPMDEMGDGVNIAVANDMLVNGDDTAAWTTKTQSTYWDSIDVDNGTDYIRAKNNDDLEDIIFNCGTFTIPTGATVPIVEVIVKCQLSADAPALQVSIFKDPNWLTVWSVGNTSLTTFNKPYLGDWTQAQLNNAKIKITTGTMAKNDTVTVYLAKIIAYSIARKCKDYIGSYNLIGKSAGGAGEEMLTYI